MLILTEIIIDSLGIFFILCTVYLVGILILRKGVWNYPVIVSAYVILAIFFLFFGVILIEKIEITEMMNILMLAVIAVWAFITCRLPARKREIELKNEN